jgi:signal transduction histidine kinase
VLFGVLIVVSVSWLHFSSLSKTQHENFLLNAKEVVSLKQQLFEKYLFALRDSSLALQSVLSNNSQSDRAPLFEQAKKVQPLLNQINFYDYSTTKNLDPLLTALKDESFTLIESADEQRIRSIVTITNTKNERVALLELVFDAKALFVNFNTSVYGKFHLLNAQEQFIIYENSVVTHSSDISLESLYPDRAEDILFADLYVAEDMYAKSIKVTPSIVYKIILQMDDTLLKEREATLLKWTLFLMAIVSLLSLPLAILFSIIPDRLNQKIIQKRDQLATLNAHLEERVEEEVRIRQQKEKVLQHQSKMAQMGEMIGAIAHQWRQPLNTLGLIATGLKIDFDLGKLNSEIMHTSLDKINNQLQFMSKTIDDFKNFFKDDKEKSYFDVATSVQDVITLLSSQIVQHSIQIEFICKDEGKEIVNIGFDEDSHKFGDYHAGVDGFVNEFKQVILNIINNAKDVFIEKELKGRITIIIDKIDAKIHINIIDNGGGIPEDIISHIFEPYFSTKGDNGTGVGLEMSKTIIEENMSGSLSVRNHNGGAHFKIILEEAYEQDEEVMMQACAIADEEVPKKVHEVIDIEDAEDYMNGLFEDFSEK